MESKRPWEASLFPELCLALVAKKSLYFPPVDTDLTRPADLPCRSSAKIAGRFGEALPVAFFSHPYSRAAEHRLPQWRRLRSGVSGAPQPLSARPPHRRNSWVRSPGIRPPPRFD